MKRNYIKYAKGTEEHKVDKDYAALMLTEILFEKGLVSKEVLEAAREKVNSTGAVTEV